MKKYLLVIMVLCAVTACKQSGGEQRESKEQLPENVCRIKGTLIGAKDGEVVLLMHNRQRDSARITNERFVIEFTMEHPDIVNMISPGGGMTLRMFLVPGHVKIVGETGALAGATLSGCGVNDWVHYISKTRVHDEAARSARNKMTRNEMPTDEEIAAIRTAQAKSREALVETIRELPDSPLSGFLLATYLTGQSDYELGKELYAGLSEKGKASFHAKMFKESSDRQGRLEGTRGQQAPAFTLIDKDGKNLSLADYKGKYVVLDFWGSWCGPCRQSHPHLIELYNKYKSKNFDIIGLAHERDTIGEKWLQAIKDDKLSWRQVNLAINKNGMEVLEAYRVNAFPTKILVDPQGQILTLYVGNSNELDDKLKELFGI